MGNAIEYNATVELKTRVKHSESAADLLVDRLKDFHAAAGASPFGRLEVTITLVAESMQQAAATALALVDQASDRPILTLEIMPTTEYDRRVGVAELPELVSVREAADILGITRQRVLQLVDAELLPASRVGNAVVMQRQVVEERAASR
jgi:excisionase family DNA binding protein